MLEQYRWYGAGLEYAACERVNNLHSYIQEVAYRSGFLCCENIQKRGLNFYNFVQNFNGKNLKKSCKI